MLREFEVSKVGEVSDCVLGCVVKVILRTLLYGDDNLDFNENKRIITETLRFINDSKRFA